MELLDKIILTVHITAGTLSLILFWIPMFTKKGSKTHVLLGKWYSILMWTVLITSLMLSIINAIQGYFVLAGFLSYLALLTGQPLWYGIVIVKHKKTVPLHLIRIKKALSIALFVFGLALIGWSAFLSFKGLAILLLIFGLLGVITTASGLTQSIHKVATEPNWLFEHVKGMVISGIAAYTAFFAFGGSQFLCSYLPGPLSAIPWVLPTVIGVVLIKRYKRSILKTPRKSKMVNTSTTRAAVTTLALLLVFNIGYSQMPYETHGNTRFAFAQLTIGGDLRYTPRIGTSYLQSSDGTLTPHDIGGDSWGRFNISGFHFWGRFDFYVSIPLLRLTTPKIGTNGTGLFDNGLESGIKYFPWKMQLVKLRPFIGISFNTMDYIQQVDEVNQMKLARITYPLQVGVNYANRNGLMFDFGITYNVQNTYDYYIGKSTISAIDLPRYSAYIGVRKIIDTTIGAIRSEKNGNLARWTDELLNSGKANSISIAIGPSAPFYINNNFNSQYYPYLGDMKVSNTFLDYGLGYYLAKQDLHFNIAYRTYTNKMNSFDTDLEYRRRSIGIEVYKFLGDYHGFVPFLGPIISYDRNTIDVNVNNATDLSIDESGLRAGITFGWDIRPTQIESLLLRTNLRVYPGYKIDVGGEAVKFAALEFNFIQVVFYPTRHIAKQKIYKATPNM